MIERLEVSDKIFLVYAEVPESWDPEYDQVLSPEELNYCRSARQLETRIARAGLRLLTKKFLPLPNEVHQSPSGKPWVGTDVQISFSHKKNTILFGARFGDKSVGVDLESLTDSVDWSVFKEGFFSDRESEHLHQRSQDTKVSAMGWTKDELSRIFFSVKEAYFKLMDQDFLPRKIEVQIEEPYEGRVKCLARPVEFDFEDHSSSLLEVHFLTLKFRDHLLTISL